MTWDIGKIISKRAQFTPKKVAFYFEDQPVTYKELNDETNRFAHFLQNKGLKKGDRIAVDLVNCIEFLSIYLAAAKLGLIFVPLNCRLVSGELEYQLSDSGARILVFHDIFTDTIDAVRKTSKIDKDKFIRLNSGVLETTKCPEWAVDYNNVIEENAVSEPELEQKVNLDDPLAIIYTSGVTGKPKGAVLSHGQTYYKNFQIMMYMDMGSEDIILSQLPLFHSGGLFIIATPSLCSGACFIMRMKFDPEQFVQDLKKHQPTTVFALTTMWRFILKTEMLQKKDTECVRVVFGGGERTPSSLIEELADIGLMMQQGFGQTENSAMMMLPKDDILRKSGSIGLPGFFSDIWIVDEQGNKLTDGEIGEIVATGPTVMSGYWNKPNETASTIIDNILHTGDLGYMDKEGYFYIVDRAKDMYRSGGENVYPAEVEKVLINHAKIENVSIIGIPDDKWGETGKAFIVCIDNETVTKEEIDEFLQGRVAKFKFPSHIELTKELPMTASGKIRKVVLKEKYLLHESAS